MRTKTKLLLASALASAVALGGCAESPKPPSASTTTAATTSASALEPSQAVTDMAPMSSATQSGDTVTCEYPASGTPAKAVDPPDGANVPATGTLGITIAFGQGDVGIVLDRSKTPCAVNSFESLVRQGYYDDTTCHRMMADLFVQCGDPDATGRGGPGYSYADELSGAETYTRGTVAMANAGSDTNGSQFFILIGDWPTLPANYDVIGHVADEASLAVLDEINAAGVDPTNSEKPAQTISIKSVTLG